MKMSPHLVALGLMLSSHAFAWESYDLNGIKVLVEKKDGYAVAIPEIYRIKLTPNFDVNRVDCDTLNEQIRKHRFTIEHCQPENPDPSESSCGLIGEVLTIFSRPEVYLNFGMEHLGISEQSASDLAQQIGIDRALLALPKLEVQSGFNYQPRIKEGSTYSMIKRARLIEELGGIEVGNETITVSDNLTACELLANNFDIRAEVKVASEFRVPVSDSDASNLLRLANYLESKLPLESADHGPFATGLTAGFWVGQWQKANPSAPAMRLAQKLLTFEESNGLKLISLATKFDAIELLNINQSLAEDLELSAGVWK